MPLVRIVLGQKLPPARTQAIADSIHRALIQSVGIPEGDRFQIIESTPDSLIHDRHYLGIERSDGVIIIQIHLALGRTLDQKKSIYRAIADRLALDAGFRPQDVFINLVEVARENWSFGNGVAQYADTPPAHLAATG